MEIVGERKKKKKKKKEKERKKKKKKKKLWVIQTIKTFATLEKKYKQDYWNWEPRSSIQDV